jgi:cytochrome c biogenesis protein CcmG/thiol:disulfide interchange protein DsbE
VARGLGIVRGALLLRPPGRQTASESYSSRRGDGTPSYATLGAMRRALPLLVAAALAAVLVIGLTQAGGGGGPAGGTAEPFDLTRAREQLRGAPAPLASLHAQSNQLLGGGRDAFAKRLRELRGHPVVINKWASWCGPCRAEFPILQDVATERGREVAFLGVDARDKRPAAADFLSRFPLPFPSYEDPDEKIARAIKAPANFPVTLFLDATGKPVFIHQGGYRTRDELAADIDARLGPS